MTEDQARLVFCGSAHVALNLDGRNLAFLPDESVHFSMSSPPFYQLRDYKLAPSIFGEDPGCAHEFREESAKRRGDTEIPHRASPGNRNIAGEKPCGTCVKCGAWRGQLGLEPTPAMFVRHLVEMYSDVHRVLRSDGLLWVEIGDTYSRRGGSNRKSTSSPGFHSRSVRNEREEYGEESATSAQETPEKNLLGIPWRFAFAMQDAGWILRCDNVWEKTNGLTESPNDRTTRSHSYVFQFSKSNRTEFWVHRDGKGTRKRPEPDYVFVQKKTGEERRDAPEDMTGWRRVNLWEGRDSYFDMDAVRTPFGAETVDRNVRHEAAIERYGEFGRPDNKQLAGGIDPSSGGAGFASGRSVLVPASGARLRSVWALPTAQFNAAKIGVEGAEHFATFPMSLVYHPLMASTSAAGCCPHCGAQWARHTEYGEADAARRSACGADASGGYEGLGEKGYADASVQNPSDVKRRILAGMREVVGVAWFPTCDCPAHEPVPPVCLDQFAGSGTVAALAVACGRRAVSVEANPDYCRIILANVAHHAADAAATRKKVGATIAKMHSRGAAPEKKKSAPSRPARETPTIRTPGGPDPRPAPGADGTESGADTSAPTLPARKSAKSARKPYAAGPSLWEGWSADLTHAPESPAAAHVEVPIPRPNPPGAQHTGGVRPEGSV